MTGIACFKKVINCLFSPLSLILLCFSLSSFILPIGKENLNYAVHARFVYHFVKYLNWPTTSKTNPKAPFVLGVWGNKTMYTELTQACAGKKLEEHPLEVQQISSQQEAMGCKLVFLGEKEQNQLSVLSKAIQNEPIVLICESAGSISQGADINFTINCCF